MSTHHWQLFIIRFYALRSQQIHKPENAGYFYANTYCAIVTQETGLFFGSKDSVNKFYLQILEFAAIYYSFFHSDLSSGYFEKRFFSSSL